VAGIEPDEREGDFTMTAKLIDGWRSDAACQNAEPELFFPISATSASAISIKHAKLICASCLVRSQCLEYALEHRQEQGIWGGLTDTERQSLRAGAASARGQPPAPARPTRQHRRRSSAHGAATRPAVPAATRPS
jgi:WhiB family transcriptional regulator, redox-sensing transcriptional regulator